MVNMCLSYTVYHMTHTVLINMSLKGPPSSSKTLVCGQENIPDTDNSPITKECDDRYVPETTQFT